MGREERRGNTPAEEIHGTLSETRDSQVRHGRAPPASLRQGYGGPPELQQRRERRGAKGPPRAGQ
jgi:hypothetical protein